CSFATISEDKICPNVKCAKDKGLNGCYECNELTDCVKGFYSRSNEYLAKAAALFIKKHGEDYYTNALSKAIADGVKFDESGSVEQALNILEKYI
ncbi:MAG TPA: hypothetical protein VHR47_10425, partial [Bacillota bacterium]|nr:hypothetical protein [Bacillota bacterium]